MIILHQLITFLSRNAPSYGRILPRINCRISSTKWRFTKYLLQRTSVQKWTHQKYIQIQGLIKKKWKIFLWGFDDVILYQLPGEKFGPGEHIVRYVATDLDDQSSKCEFTISVKRKPNQLHQYFPFIRLNILYIFSLSSTNHSPQRCN